MTQLLVRSLLSIAFAILATGCISIRVHRETFEEQLFRHEGVTCGDITAHEEGDPPSCARLYEAFDRGRDRVKKLYPQAARVPMSTFHFARTHRYWTPTGPTYPSVSLSGNDDGPFSRGYTFPRADETWVVYSYEEVVEHETVHALVIYLDGDLRRNPAAVAEDPGQSEYYGKPLEWFWQIVCHGTPDDPFGKSGDQASCAKPYHYTK